MSARVKEPGDAVRLDRAIGVASDALIRLQNEPGFWCFELEADCTIPAEYIMMMHFLDEIDLELQRKIAVYLRRCQADHGGWPLYHGGALDLSATIKAYYALKLAGDSPDAPHMARARAAVLARGGAARANVFTRIALALFGQVPWRAVPYIPVEIMLLPKWFPFHLDKVSYWSRTVMVPLFVLCTEKPLARNPGRVNVRELFAVPPEQERHWFARGGLTNRFFLVLDHLGRAIDQLIPDRMRRAATRRAQEWMLERLNGLGGLGAIFPAMVNALEVLVLMGVPPDDPRRRTAKEALEKLLVVTEHEAYCQPCVSPVWDTALAALALQAAGDEPALAAAERGFDWLVPEQLLEGFQDWLIQKPDVRGGGWAFQFKNTHYPDLDDTAAVVWGMLQSRDPARYANSISRALDWLVGLQSRNGGFAAFDADNTHYILNEIPFADHGALLDPPTEDVTARVVIVLSRTRRPQDAQALARAIAYLRAEQKPAGCWWGRWGTNCIYGTWSVLTALDAAGIGGEDPMVRRAAAWLMAKQNADGGWGESNDSYADPALEGGPDASSAFQTAWALLGLINAGEAGSEAARRGAQWLMDTQEASGLWSDPRFTAPGFPRVFYLKYHGYSAYFPLWALAEYRRRTGAGSLR